MVAIAHALIALYGVIRLAFEYSRITADFMTFRFYQKTSTLRQRPWVAVWSTIVLGVSFVEGTIFFVFIVFTYITYSQRSDFKSFDSTSITKIDASVMVSEHPRSHEI